MPQIQAQFDVYSYRSIHHTKVNINIHIRQGLIDNTKIIDSSCYKENKIIDMKKSTLKTIYFTSGKEVLKCV